MTPVAMADAAQRWTLRAGACFDGAFGLAMLAGREPASRLLRLDLPSDGIVYFELSAVLLLLLAGIYALASTQARWSHGVGWVAGGGRLLGAIVLARAAIHGGEAAFGAAAAADATLGVLHLLAAAMARRRRAAA